MKKKIQIISFSLSFIYVFIGTITVMASFSKYEIMGFNHDHILWTPLVVITFPVNLLLFGLVMVDNSVLSIVIIQAIVFCLFWFLLYKILIRLFRYTRE